MPTTDSPSSHTSTTTTTTTSWERVRKNGGWLPVATGAVGLAVLGLVNGLPMRSHVEKDLTDRSTQVLAKLGSGLTVDFTGRDGIIKGTLPDGVTKEQVLQAVSEVDGVRVVSFVPSGASSSPTALPSESTSPSASPSAAALGLPSVTAVATDGAVVLTGKVPTQEAADALAKAAAEVYEADKVTNQLTIDPTVSDAGIGGFGALFGALGKEAAATAALADGTLTLSGSVADAAAQKAAEAAAGAVTGDPTKVVDQLKVSEPEPSASPSPSPAATSGSSTTGVQAQLNGLPLVLFDTASNSLTPKAQAAIKQAAEVLKANPTVKVRLDGHTDDLGAARVNNELSAARAMTVRSYLIQLGVAADRLTYGYHGYAEPQVANRDDAARARNRRVTFTVL